MKLTSAKCEWRWNKTYQKLYKRVKSTIKKDAFMKFYNEKELLYLETYALGAGLGGDLMQVKDRLWFPKDEGLEN